MAATEAEIKLCEEKHKTIDHRLDSIENKMWIMIGAAFLQIMAVLGYFLVNFHTTVTKAVP